MLKLGWYLDEILSNNIGLISIKPDYLIYISVELCLIGPSWYQCKTLADIT